MDSSRVVVVVVAVAGDFSVIIGGGKGVSLSFEIGIFLFFET